MKEALYDIWMAEARESAQKAYDAALIRLSEKYPRVMDCLAKERKRLMLIGFATERRG